MLFEHLLEPGDRVVVEQPTYDRTLLLLQRLGRRAGAGAARGRRPRRRGLRSGPRRGAGQARPRDPQLPQPGRLHALGREAACGWSSSPPSTASGSSRTTPTASCPSRARRWRRCSRSTRPERVIHASSFSKTVSPGVRVGYLAGPGGGDREARQARQRDLHLAQHAGRGGRPRALPLGRPRPQHRVRQGRAARAARRPGRGARRADPRGRVRRPRRRLLPLARPRRGHRHARPCSPRPRARASPSSPAPTS